MQPSDNDLAASLVACRSIEIELGDMPHEPKTFILTDIAAGFGVGGLARPARNARSDGDLQIANLRVLRGLDQTHSNCWI